MRRATYANGVQFLPWMHVKCTCMVLLVQKDVAKSKKIASRVSLTRIVAARRRCRKSHVASQTVVL